MPSQHALHCLSRVLRAAPLLACCAAWPAWAQFVTPGAVMDTLPAPKPMLPPTPAEVVFPVTRPNAVHDPSAPRFTVNAFQFVGNTVFTQSQLKQLTERFVDLELNLYDLNRAADTVTRLYRESGYPIARAIIPAQKVADGIVRIEVIEGRISKTSIVGNNRYPTELISSRLGTLQQNEIITLDHLERSLLLMNDLPGLAARATLAPGADYGTTDMVIRAEETGVAGAVTFDNQGLKETGQLRVDAGVDINNPFGIGDQINVRAIKTEHDLLSYGRIGYSLPLSSNGTRLGATYSRVNYDVAGQFAVLGITGEVTNAEFLLTWPYLRSRARNIIFGIGVRRTETSQTTLGLLTLDTRIDLLNLTMLGSWVHEDSAFTNFSAAFASNGKKNPYGLRQDSQEGKLDINLTHLRAASKNWDLYLRGNMVFSAGALADTEKFSLGGPGSVRGYRQSELRGDDGWQATIEVRRQFVLGNTAGMVSTFYDEGSVKAKGFTRFDSIRSAGVGVGVFPNKNLRANVEYAYPISDRVSADGNRGRAWFSVTASF